MSSSVTQLDFSPAARLRIQDALIQQFNAYLRPGERLRLDVETAPEFVCAALRLETADRSERLELEAALLAHDQPDGQKALDNAPEALEQCFDLLRGQLSEYLVGGRRRRFHADWRVLEGTVLRLRFRGQQHHPSLDAQANALLGDDFAEDED